MRINKINIKVAFLFGFTGFAFLVLCFDHGLVKTTHASISGPPAARTGAPGEQTCTSCHNSSALTGQFSIVAPATYTPGQTYQIQVKHITTDTTRKRWGFELTSLASNTNAGTFANLNGTTKIISGSGRNYIEHTTSGTFQNQVGGSTWTFNWTAPGSNIGNVTFYAAGLQANNNGSESGDQTYTTNVVIQPGATTVVLPHVFSDFDGDGKSDPGVFRPTQAMWYVNQSSNSQSMSVPFGLTSDALTPADFDGDNKTDVAVWRSGDAGAAGFYIFQSTTNAVRFELFGQTGDDPSIVGDWDGDGKADPAVYRNAAVGSQSYFYFRGSANNPSGSITYLPWGTSGDRPMLGDFDGDGKQDLAVFRPSNTTWYINRSSNAATIFEHWGIASDKFVSGDYDGDGKTDLVVYRNGVWYIRQSSNGQSQFFYWGLSTDQPISGDFDSDGKADIGVFRNGAWYILNSGTGQLSIQTYGTASDLAIPGLYVR